MNLLCPKCGGEVAGFDVIPGNARIVDWTIDPETGEREPEWEGTTDVCWNGQRPANPDRPYGCLSCCRSFAASELIEEKNGTGTL